MVLDATPYSLSGERITVAVARAAQLKKREVFMLKGWKEMMIVGEVQDGDEVD
jgi:hypothetical protein